MACRAGRAGGEASATGQVVGCAGEVMAEKDPLPFPRGGGGDEGCAGDQAWLIGGGGRTVGGSQSSNPGVGRERVPGDRGTRAGGRFRPKRKRLQQRLLPPVARWLVVHLGRCNGWLRVEHCGCSTVGCSDHADAHNATIWSDPSLRGFLGVSVRIHVRGDSPTEDAGATRPA